MDMREIKKVTQDSITNLNDLLKVKQHKQTTMTNVSLSNLFLLLERGDTLTSISRQVFLSELVELIGGIFVSDDIWYYRGLLLNIERSMTYFYLFDKIFNFFEDSFLSQLSYECFTVFQRLFENMWELRFPWGFIRPGTMLEPIESRTIPDIKKILRFLESRAFTIAKKIESSSQLKTQLTTIKTLGKEEIRKTGMTGPIDRTIGILPRLNSISTINLRKSSAHFIQYAYTSNNNMWNLLRVSYVELILSLNRISKFLKPYPVMKGNISKERLDGDNTCSFQTVLGEGHFTLNISQDKVSYFNYIPPQIVNSQGIETLVNKTPVSFHPLLSLFHQPFYSKTLER